MSAEEGRFTLWELYYKYLYKRPHIKYLVHPAIVAVQEVVQYVSLDRVCLTTLKVES